MYVNLQVVPKHWQADYYLARVDTVWIQWTLVIVYLKIVDSLVVQDRLRKKRLSILARTSPKTILV